MRFIAWPPCSTLPAAARNHSSSLLPLTPSPHRTPAQGIAESNDKVVLATTGASFTVNVACNLFVSLTPLHWKNKLVGVAWVSASALVLSVGGLVARGKMLTGKIEGMEVTAARCVQ